MSWNYPRPLLGLASLAVLTATFHSAPAGASQVATPMVHSGGVHFAAHVEYSRAVLTVTGNGIDLRREAEAGESLAIEIFDDEGELLPDGNYSWELRLVPSPELARELRRKIGQRGGDAPKTWRPVSGTITLRGGHVVSQELSEPTSADGRHLPEAAVESTTVSQWRSEPPIDDDAAVGERSNLEEETRAAIASAPPSTGGAPATDSMRSDAAALQLGGSVEPPLEPLGGEAESLDRRPPTQRSIDPEGKNGRPRASDSSPQEIR